MRRSLLSPFLLVPLAAFAAVATPGLAHAAGPPSIEVHRGDTGADIPMGGSLNMGTTALGVPFSIYFVVGNIADIEPLQVSGASAPSGITITQLPPSTIVAGTSHAVRVRCDATSAGVVSGDFVILSDDPDSSPFTFQLSCTVNPVIEQPGFRLTAGLSTPIADGGTLTVASGSTFGVFSHNDDGGNAPLVLGLPSSNPVGPKLSGYWVVDAVVAAGGVPQYTAIGCRTGLNVPITGSYVISISSNAPGNLATYSFTLVCGTPTPSDTTPNDTTPNDTTPNDTTPNDTTPNDTTPSGTTPNDTSVVEDVSGAASPTTSVPRALPTTGLEGTPTAVAGAVLLGLGLMLLRLVRRPVYARD